MSLLSFLMLVSPVFSLFVHVILLRSLSVVLTFSEASFQFYWFFSIFVFTSTDDCSYNCFIPSACFWFILLLFSGFLHQKLGLLRWDDSFFFLISKFYKHLTHFDIFFLIFVQFKVFYNSLWEFFSMNLPFQSLIELAIYSILFGSWL